MRLLQNMTIAARPTWAPAKGGNEQGGTRIFSPSQKYSSRDIASHTTLKPRKDGQDTKEELQKRNLRDELEEREWRHFSSKDKSYNDRDRRKGGHLLLEEQMYHHHHHQGKNIHPFSRGSIPPERHLFLQWENGAGDSGLVLSADAKPRLKWTQDLHEQFIETVNQLGGADKTTPKIVLKLMGVPGLTLYHLKSHLQKYRLSKNLHGHSNTGTNKIGERMSEANGTHESLHISEAIRMQTKMQTRLHEQLERYSKDRSSVVAIGLNVHTALVDDTSTETMGIYDAAECLQARRDAEDRLIPCSVDAYDADVELKSSDGSDDDNDEDDEDGTEALLLELEQIKKELAIF
ncbi:unnamed protein product [Camellia sinensis]